MALRVKKHLMRHPPGGWRFEEDGFMFAGDGPADLAGKVRDYRIRMHRPPGDPEGDVMAWICGHWPYLCEECEDCGESREDDREAFTAIRDWLYSLSGRELQFVLKIDAIARYEACLRCPMNEAMDFPGEDEEAEFNRVLMINSRGGSAKTRGAYGCRHFFHHNGLAVFLKDPKAGPDGVIEAAPEACWVKKLHKTEKVIA